MSCVKELAGLILIQVGSAGRARAAVHVRLATGERDFHRMGYLQHRRSRSRLSAGLVAGCA